MEFDQILKEVNEHYGQEIFVLDEQNACRASVGDGLIIEVLYVPEVERVVLSADIGAEPPENRDRVYRLMLQAQYMFRGTAGASFALDGDTGAVYLEKPMPLATMTSESFVDSFETFACVARKWRETLADFVPLAEEIGDFERKVEASERLEQQSPPETGSSRFDFNGKAHSRWQSTSIRTCCRRRPATSRKRMRRSRTSVSETALCSSAL